MSILQANYIYLNSNGSTKIAGNNENIDFYVQNNSIFTESWLSNVASQYIPTGTIMLSSNSTTPPGYVEVTNTALAISQYPVLGNLFKDKFLYDTPDLNTWTQISNTTSNAIILYDVVYYNNTFIIAGSNNLIQTSTNGTTWTNRLSVGNSSVNTNIFYKIAYGNGVYVAVGYGFIEAWIATSADGINWVRKTPPNNSIQSITYGNGIFVITTGHNSTDGITWSLPRVTANIGFNDITYGNGIFVGAGIMNGFISYSYTKNNGNWFRSVFSGETIPYSSVTYGNGLFVAVGTGAVVNVAPFNIRVSYDGENWGKAITSSNVTFQRVTYFGNKFVAVGNSAEIQTSTDGFFWETQENDITQYTLNGVASGGGITVVVGANGFIATSNNTISYNTQTHFKIPPYNGYYSPVQTTSGNVFIYMKT